MDRNLFRTTVQCGSCLLLALMLWPSESLAQRRILDRVLGREPLIQRGEDPPPARLAPLRGRLLERDLRAREEYYDELEDYYDDRNPELARYYERMENYYEDVRKGRRARMPAPYAGAGPLQPRFPAPDARDRRYREPGYVEPEFAEPDYAASGDGRLQPPASDRSQSPDDARGSSMSQAYASRTAQDPPPRPTDPLARLQQAYAEFTDNLSQLPGSDDAGNNRWQEYLELPLSTEPRERPDEYLTTAAGRRTLASALERYDRVAGDPQYRQITRLPAFGATRNALRDAAQWLDEQPTLAPPDESVAADIAGPILRAPQQFSETETLPAPTPDEDVSQGE